MIWLVWRQHRKQALFTLAGLAVLAALMVPTGLAMRHTFAELRLDDCVRAVGDAALVPADTDAACDRAFSQFGGQYDSLSLVGILFVVVPLLVGLFWGAPLVAREVEHGTHRLVWTQGVSRRHWALVKFGLVGAFTLAVAVVYGLGVSWWHAPLSRTGQQSRLEVLLFDMQGVAPIGYTLFAVALGIIAGTVWPKVLPAMAATLAGFVALRIPLTVLARPRYLPAEELTYPVAGGTVQPNPVRGDWLMSTGVRDADGRLVAANAEMTCVPDVQDPAASCDNGAGIGSGAYNWRLYQPADRFWLFQAIETGIFVALAVLLVYLAIRRVRRIA